MNNLNITLVIVYHYTRCGSTAVADIMDRVPGVANLGEIFNPDNEWAKILGREDVCTGDGSKNSIEIIASLINSAIGAFCKNSNYIFIEVTEWDVYRKVFDSTVENMLSDLRVKLNASIKFVHLVRENVFRRYLSTKFATFNNVYHVKSENFEFKPIEIDVDDMLENIHWYLKLYHVHDEQFSSIFVNDYIRLTYENDIEKNPIVAVRKLLNFAGVPISKLESSTPDFIIPTSRFKKILSANLTSYIKNYPEVVLALNNEGFGWMSV